MQKHLEIIGERAAQAYDETLDATLAIQIFGPVVLRCSPQCAPKPAKGVSLTVATEHLGGFTRRPEPNLPWPVSRYRTVLGA